MERGHFGVTFTRKTGGIDSRQRGVVPFDFRPALKASLKSAGIPRGWSVTEHRGRVKLRVRTGAGASGPQWNKTLPIAWEIGCIGPVTELLITLHKATSSEPPRSLAEAWAELHPEPTASNALGRPALITGINWSGIAAAFYGDRAQNGTQVGPRTLAMEKRYCDQAIALLAAHQPPTTPYKLIDATIRAGGWSNKPRARQQCVGAITRLLTYGVDHESLSSDWLLPQHQKLKLAGNGKPEQKKEIAILSDLQILALLETITTREWHNLILVMAIYGLRPEELMHLQPRLNPTTNRQQMWCSYQKAAGGRTKKTQTEPRWLQAIPLSGPTGTIPATDLAASFEAGLMTFPPLKDRGEAVSQYLRRLPLWRQWSAEFEAKGQSLRPYSFRNSYSVRAHLRGIPGASVARAMGHSEKTHSAHYVTATEETTTEVFERILNSSAQPG